MLISPEKQPWQEATGWEGRWGEEEEALSGGARLHRFGEDGGW